MVTGRLRAFNFQKWISENQHLLKPPVGNKKVFEDGEMTVQVVGGPNERTDYHDDPVEEFFYQLKGDMVLKVCDDGKFYDVPIREGEIFLLPANMPHSPQRLANTVGLVIERQRRAGERDGFQWYCENCDTKLHEEFIELTDIEKQLPPVFERFFGNLAYRTCKQCGEVLEKPQAKTQKPA